MVHLRNINLHWYINKKFSKILVILIAFAVLALLFVYLFTLANVLLLSLWTNPEIGLANHTQLVHWLLVFCLPVYFLLLLSWICQLIVHGSFDCLSFAAYLGPSNLYHMSWCFFLLSAFLQNFIPPQGGLSGDVLPHLVQPCCEALGRALDLGLVSRLVWGHCQEIVSDTCHLALYYLNSDKPFLTLSSQNCNPERGFKPGT